jgi:hypothetical protein
VDLRVDDGFLAFHLKCEGSKHHSPTPLILRQVSLIPKAGTAVIHPTAILCGVCRDNLRVYQSLLVAHDGVIPWEVQRCFGNQIRALALKGWDLHKEGRSREV